MWGVGSYQEGLPKESKTVGSRPGKLACSNHTEANGESIIDANNRVDNMLTYRIELAGNPNSCIIKINNQKFHALLDSGTEVSLINTKVYKRLKGLPKLQKQTAFLQSVKGDPISVDGCLWLKYEIGREKQEHEFFVVSEMNRNIILGCDWLRHFGV